MKKSFITYIPLIILLFLAGCTPHQRKTKRIINVTIEPQKYFIEQIAGDKFKIETMVPKGNNPENYDPTPSQIVALNKSEGYLRIGGLGFENAWINRLLSNAPHLLLFNESAGIKETSNKDPHTWESTKNVLTIANNICRMLIQLDKNNETYYIQQTIAFKKRVNILNDSIKFLLKNSNKSFVIYHPSLTYFARDYGLKQIVIEENGKTPSPMHLQDVIKDAKKNKVKIIFVQKEFDQHNAEIIAKSINAKIIPIDPIAHDWAKQMLYIAQQLKH